MIRWFGGVIGAVLVAATAAGAAKIPSHPSKLAFDSLGWEVPRGEPFRVELPGGIVAYVAEDRSLPLINVGGYVSTGSVFDPAGKEGLGTLAARMLKSGGTEKYSADTLDLLLDLFAIDVSFRMKETEMHFGCSFLAEFTDTALDILEQMLFHPAFEEGRLKRERALLAERIIHRFDNPGPVAAAAYEKLMYPGTPVSRLAVKATLDSIRREDILAFHASTIRPGNMILAVAGKFDRDSMIAKLRRMLPAEGDSSRRVLAVEAMPKPARKCLFVHKEISQSYVRFGIPIVKRPHPDYYPLTILNEILGGGGFTSRLGKKIRSDEGLTYSIYSRAGSSYLYPATLFVTFHTKASSTAKAMALSLKEVRRLRREGITGDELRRAKDALIEGYPSMFRTPVDITDNYAWNEYYGRDSDHFEKYPARIKAITKERVEEVAEKYLDPGGFSFAVVGDTARVFPSERYEDFSLRGLTPFALTDEDSLPELFLEPGTKSKPPGAR